MRKKIFPPLSSIIRRRKLPWLLHLYKHFFLEMTTKQLKNHPGKMPHPDGGDGSVKVAKAWPQTHLLHQLHWREGPHDHLISGIQMCTNPKTLHHPGQLLLPCLGVANRNPQYMEAMSNSIRVELGMYDILIQAILKTRWLQCLGRSWKKSENND